MKLFVTGAEGQLGFELCKKAKDLGFDIVASDIKDKGSSDNYIKLDITNELDVYRVIKREKPDAVIHCAAWSLVDAAEALENREKVYAINVSGTKNIANACKELDCKMIYISTDYVFDGKGNTPIEADAKNFAPLNYYGETKYEGEKLVSSILNKFFIVRIAWAFGRNGSNFVKTMINVGKTHHEVRVVNDQIGTPTYMPDLSDLLLEMVKSDKYGFYNATNEGGFISWYDFCKEIYRQYGLDTKVISVSTEEYGQSIAKRPYNSRLSKEKLKCNGFKPLPDWKDAVSRYIKEEGL